LADFDPAVESFPRIKNRYGLEVFIKLLMVPGAQHNVYLAHGLGNAHDGAVLRGLTRAFVDSGYNVIVWDATNAPNRSEGSTGRASFYYYHQDLEDVVDWSKGQPWFKPEFAMAGHSLGGMASGVYAAAHPQQVERLVLVAPVVSGPALRRRVPAPLRWWWRWRGELRPRMLGRNPYGWEFIRSGWSYNLLAEAPRLTMPVLIVGAARDVLIPTRLLRRLYRRLPGERKELVIVPGARHGFNETWEMDKLTEVVKQWLKTLDHPHPI